MAMRVPLTARIGLTLILVGFGAYAGIGRWMGTRIVHPVDMPISLAAGHIHSGPFRLNLKTDYWVVVSPGEWWRGDRQCEPYPRLRTRWVLYQKGSVVDQQAEATYYPTSFRAGPGVYDLDIEVPSDLGCLDAGHPRLDVNANMEYYRAVAFLMRAAAGAGVFIGVTLLAFLPVVRAVRSSRQMPSLTAPETASQNFQWAQRLPLRRPISGMPGFGLVGGIIFATFAMVMMLLTIPMTPKGLWVHLLKPGAVPAKSDNWTDPLVVRVKYRGPGKEAAVVVNSREVAWDDLNRTLKEELSRRREWVVYVGGDDCVGWSNIAQVIDAARGEQAKVVLVTGDNGKQDCQANFGAKPARR